MVIEIIAKSDKFDVALSSIDQRLSTFEKSVNTTTAKAQTAFESVSGAIGKISTGLALIGAAAGLGGLVSLTKNAIDSASAIHDLSERLGVNSEELQALHFAVTQAGGSIEGFDSGILKFQKNIADAAQGTGKAKDAIRELGLNAKDLAGDPTKALTTVIEKLSGVQNQAKFAQLTLAIFGKGFGDQIPVLKEFGGNLEEIKQQARDSGNVLSTQLTNKADELGDKFDEASGSIKNLATTGLVVLGEAVVALVTKLEPLTTALTNIILTATQLNEVGTKGRMQELVVELHDVSVQIVSIQQQLDELGPGKGPSLLESFLGADTRANLARDLKVLQDHAQELRDEFTKLGDTSSETGKKIETALVPPVDKAGKKLEEARKEIEQQIIVLNKQSDVLDQVVKGQLAYSEAVVKLAAIEKGAKGQSDELTASLEKATKRKQEDEKVIKETIQAYDDLTKKLADYNKELADSEQSLNDQIKGQETYLDALKAAIANGENFATAQRDAAKASELATFWMGEYRKAQKGGFDDAGATALANSLIAAKEKTIDLTNATEDFKTQAQDSYLHLGDIIKQGIQGLAQGTLDISDFLKQQGQAAITAFASSFLLGKKGLLDIPFAANIMGLVGPGGLIGDLFGQGGAQAAASFTGSFTSGFQGAGGGTGIGSVFTSAGQTASKSFGTTFLSGIDNLFGTNLAQFGPQLTSAFATAGTLAAIAMGGAFIGQGLATLFGMKSHNEQLGAGIAGALFGGILGPLGGLIGGLFDHIPTAGTIIRKSIKEYLNDIKVSFADEIDSGNYFFQETKDLADKMFGGDFLKASKQILIEKNGPELAKQLQALGTFLTADAALKNNKSVEQAATTFGNMLSDALLVSDLPAAIQEIVEKGKITLVDLTNKLTKVFQDGKISADFYKTAIAGAVDIFSTDLPEAIHVSSIALKSFSADGIFELDTFQKKTKEAMDQYSLIVQTAFDAISTSKSGEEAARMFGEGLQKGLAQLALQTFIQDFVDNQLFKGIDLSDGLDSGEIALLTERIRQARIEADALTTAMGGVTNSTQDLIDKIAQLNQQLLALVQKRIDIRIQLATDLGAIGALTPAQVSQAKLAQFQPGVDFIKNVQSPIATQKFSGLSDAEITKGISDIEGYKGALIDSFNAQKGEIEANLQTQTAAINAGLQSQISAINAASQAQQAAIHAEFEAKRQGVQDTIKMLQDEKTQQQQLFQARIDALQKELQLAQAFQQLAASLQDQIRGLVTSASPYTGTEQLTILQLQAEDIRRQIAAATPEQQPALIQDLGRILGEQLQVGKGLPNFDDLFQKVVGELEALQQDAAGKGAKAEDLQQQIANATDDMNASLASIDVQIQAQQQLLSDLSAQESAAITAAQQSAANQISAAQASAAAQITAAQEDANEQIQALRNATAAQLTGLADLEDQLVKEQIRRAEVTKNETLAALNAIALNTEALNQIAADNAAFQSVMLQLTITLGNLNAFLGATPGFASGTQGVVTVNRPSFIRVAEDRPENLWVGPVGGGTGGGGSGAVNISLSPTFAVTLQGSGNPEADGRRFARGAQQELIYMVQHDELGQVIVKKVREGRGI